VNTHEALSILKIIKKEGIEEVEAAYLKMIKRFPPEHFPEKSILIKNAYNVLVGNRDYWKTVFSFGTLDLLDFDLSSEISEQFEQEDALRSLSDLEYKTLCHDFLNRVWLDCDDIYPDDFYEDEDEDEEE
jgi:hypothetical protein